MKLLWVTENLCKIQPRLCMKTGKISRPFDSEAASKKMFHFCANISTLKQGYLKKVTG